MTSKARSPLGILPEGWRLVHLRDITSKIGSGATPKGGESVYLQSRINCALVRSQNVHDRWFDSASLAFISDEHARELAGVELRTGDLLLNITGDGVTFARSCIVPDEVLPARVNQHVAILRTRPDVCISGYLLSYLTHPAIKEYIESFNSGGSRRAITKGHIESFVVPLPPLSEQARIDRILSTLDRKIEQGRSINQTLEAMARAIFKSWFVDFDPVREEHPQFPKALAISTDSQIPEGWTLGQLGDIVEVIDCLHSKKPERRPEGKILLQLGNILDSGLLDMTDTYLISPEDYELWTSRMEAREGDCVITNVGRVGAVAQIPSGLQAALGRNMTGLRCRPEFPYPTFLIESLGSSAMREEISCKTDSGTILDSLNVRNIPKLRLVIPTEPVVREFERICRPMRAKMESNLEESRTLTALRDTLLPKLLSGEIRVKQAEKIMGEVA